MSLWYAGNILLDGSGVVKVADFGLSRLQAATCGEPLTAELGTWQWMAPEVVAPWDKRGAVYTEKADVYSFGIVMWECAAREVVPPNWLLKHDKIAMYVAMPALMLLLPMVNFN